MIGFTAASMNGRGYLRGMITPTFRGLRRGGLAALLAGLAAIATIHLGAEEPARASSFLQEFSHPPASAATSADIAVLHSDGVKELAAAAPFILSNFGASNRMQAEKCLADAIYYEAGSESEVGQRAVAQVVLNRVRHPMFPSSICGVVYQGAARSTGCQFTFACDGSLARAPSRSGWAEATAIAKRALEGSVYAPVGYATHYHASWMLPYWASSVEKIGRVGGHIFYRWKGESGRPESFSQTYVADEASVHGSQPVGNVTEPELAEFAFVGENSQRQNGLDPLSNPKNADLLEFRKVREGHRFVGQSVSKIEDAIQSALR